VSDLTVIIPAAGLGRRMRSFGPKALIEVTDRQTILGRQLAILRGTHPDADVVVVAGYEAERVIRALPAGVRVVENDAYEDTNVARSLALGLRSSRCKRALVVYGDLVFSKATLDGLDQGRSCVVVDTRGQMREFEVGCTVVGGKVTHFSYGLDTKWAQVAYLAGRELGLFRRLVGGRDRRRHFGFEVLNEVLEHGGELRAVEPVGMKIVEVDTSKDIEQARSVFRSAVGHRG
jgi:choline kinase